MLVFIGDIHGNFGHLRSIVDAYVNEPNVTFIQVGDLGFFPRGSFARWWNEAKITAPIYFIDGNHDHNAHLATIQGVSEVWHNAFYVPRGTVLQFDGKKIGFLGGAGSVDKKWRAPHIDWFPEEQISLNDIQKLYNSTVDILVTHTPPISCVRENFDPVFLEQYFDLPRTWVDPSAVLVDELWHKLNLPPIICGHMHRSVRWHNVTILGVEEHLKVE